MGGCGDSEESTDIEFICINRENTAENDEKNKNIFYSLFYTYLCVCCARDRYYLDIRETTNVQKRTKIRVKDEEFIHILFEYINKIFRYL